MCIKVHYNQTTLTASEFSNFTKFEQKIWLKSLERDKIKEHYYQTTLTVLEYSNFTIFDEKIGFNKFG